MHKADRPYVVVVWEDAWGDAVDYVSLSQPDSKHRPTVMETRGWLVTEDEKGVSIFNERCLDKGEEYYRGRTYILRSLIRSITEVRLTIPRKKAPHAPPAVS